MTRKKTLAVAIALTFAAPGAAWATNGYFAHGYGTTSKALAGAGVAYSQDALAAATNPAGMVTIGGRTDASLAVFSPRREYTVGNPQGAGSPNVPLQPGTVESDSDWHLIPAFGYNHMLDENNAIGISVYGNGGMNTDYPAFENDICAGFGGGSGSFCGGETGVDLMQLFIAPTYARKVNDNIAVGISPILAYQRFEAKGLGAFGQMGFSSDPNNLTNRGTDDSFGYGAKVGIQGEAMPGLRLGASYQTKMRMDEFDKYSGLFAEQGGFDIPATATVGLAFDIAPQGKQGTLLFDVQHIWYSDINSIANPFASPGQLGDDNGPGFGWRDMTIYKLGYQWQHNQDWTWRVGYSYGEQPIRSSEVLFNILAPGIMEHHITGGFTRRMGNNQELNFAAMYAPKRTVSGTNPLDGQTIELQMRQFEIELGYAWRF
ncbi:outer membrane protein transport protein [Ectothiorhodospiraceae bacterium 2226]|nr:outer membrane protein transport protein [Ectothiorhodospiraceae bacterium 2226]